MKIKNGDMLVDYKIYSCDKCGKQIVWVGKSIPPWVRKEERQRNSPKYKIWREKVFERDDYTCQICNRRGGSLNAHHIKPFKDYPKLRFDVKNGVTLCEMRRMS